jgi:hypothetical protein
MSDIAVHLLEEIHDVLTLASHGPNTTFHREHVTLVSHPTALAGAWFEAKDLFEVGGDQVEGRRLVEDAGRIGHDLGEDDMSIRVSKNGQTYSPKPPRIEYSLQPTPRRSPKQQ